MPLRLRQRLLRCRWLPKNHRLLCYFSSSPPPWLSCSSNWLDNCQLQLLLCTQSSGGFSTLPVGDVGEEEGNGAHEEAPLKELAHVDTSEFEKSSPEHVREQRRC